MHKRNVEEAIAGFFSKNTNWFVKAIFSSKKSTVNVAEIHFRQGGFLLSIYIIHFCKRKQSASKLS